MTLDEQSPERTPLRVAVVASVDSTVQRLLAEQVRAMQAAGYDVRCLCTPGSSHDWLVAHGFHMVDVRIPRRFSPFADLKALWTMYRYFVRERIAVVHTHTPKPALFGQLAARLAGVPVVINTLHGFYFHEHMPPMTHRFYLFWETLAARLSSVILSQNPEDIETAVRLRVVPRARMRLLGNGVDLNRFDPQRFDAASRARVRRALGIADDAIVVTIIARRVREKGYFELFEAMQSVMQRHSNAHLVIIGPGDPVKRDRVDPESMTRYGIDQRTHWLGRREDVPELLASTDVFALPSWREGFPRSAIEAAASGKPIVTTDVRGCRQVVQNGVNGLLVPLRDATALGAALEQLVESPSLRLRYGQASRAKALREFDEQSVIRIVLDTIGEQLRNSRHISEGHGPGNGAKEVERTVPASDVAGMLPPHSGTVRRAMSRRTWAVATLAAALLYVGAMAPGLTWGDPGNVQLRTLTGLHFDPVDPSRSHVLFYVVTIAIAKLGLAPFQAANLVSAVAGALTVGNLAWLLTLLVRRRIAVFCGTALLLCSHALWHLASLAEVMTFSTMLLSLELILVVKSIETRRDGWIIAAAFVNGLGLATHNMSLLIWPAYVVLLAMQYRRVRWPSRYTLLWCFVALCAGASPLVALFVNTATQSDGSGHALSLILSGRFETYVYNTSLPIRTIAKMFVYTGYSFPSPLVLLGLPGVLALWRRESRELFWFLTIAFCGYFVFAVRYTVPDQHAFMLHCYLFLMVFVSIGIDRLLDWEYLKPSFPHGGPHRVRGCAVAVVLVVFSMTAPVVYAIVPGLLRSYYPDLAPLPRRQIRYRDTFDWLLKPWHSGYDGAERFARDTFGDLPRGALLVVDSTLMPPLLYLQNSEKLRRDVEIHSAHVYQPWLPSVCDIDSDEGVAAIRAGRVFTVSDRREEVNYHLRDSRYRFTAEGVVFRVVLDDD